MMMNQEDEVAHSSFDYIIIGAGPSACGLLHGLLSHGQQVNNSSKHQTPRTICVIEAGSQQTSTNAKDWPKTAFYTNKHNNNYISTPQSALNNRILDIPIGNGLGGTSNINACLLSFPNFTNDFKCWPEKYQDGMIIKSACDHLVSFMRSSGSVANYKVCQKFMNVLGDDNDGSCDVQQEESVRLATSNDGKRVKYFDSLVQPLIDNQQQLEDTLTIRTNTIAERLLWEENKNNKEKQINGVVCKDQQSNQKCIISANRQVILCAGAIHSPVILMRSGIGDETELGKLDIHCNNNNKSYHNLPGVGKKLKDHLVIPRAFVTSSQVDCCQSLNGVQTIFNDTFVLMDGCVLKHAGPLMISSVFRRGYQHTKHINIITCIKQYTFHIIYTLILTILHWTVKYIEPIRHFMTYHTSTLLITILHPKSHGTVTLTSLNQIQIDPGYLKDESDYVSVVQAWNQSTRIKDRVMNKCWEILPGKLYKLYFSLSTYWGRGSRKGSSSSNDEEVIITYAKQFIQPYFHYIGTCSMINNTTSQSSNKQEEEAVVDENFKVIGIQGLRICDASVFVDCISAPTALTCASLGYVLSDILIKEED